MPVKNGDFILVDYTGRVKETGEVFETTIEDVVREEGLYREGELYEPKLIVVGEGWVLKSLDEAFLEMKVGRKTKVEVPPEKAFGLRDPKNVRMIPIRRLRSRKINPVPGMRLEYDGKLATVRSVGAGRVQLDFNPSLAGKTLVYDMTIKRRLTRRLDKISALIHRRIPLVEVEKFKFKIVGKEVTIELPQEAFYIEGLQFMKRGIAMDILKFLKKISTVKFIESYGRPESAEVKPEIEKSREGN